MLAALSASCGPRLYVFRCADGYVVRAQFTGDGARLRLPDTTLTMPHLRSADGARYGVGDLVFWERGNSAFMQRGDSIIHRDCRLDAND
ncbi:MAG: MliC family protein [Gemmatimonadota bacterium]|nr:MliC family protein [Gemmatimonadota bacterium]